MFEAVAVVAEVIDGERNRGICCSRSEMSAAEAALEQAGADGVLKSGPLFISSKGLGWKYWKRRWFILTKTSLVFFKRDPSIIVKGGGEVNLTLGGIDLNNSGRVIVREDKRLLSILLPDGQDGRAFTLKTETSEDLHEWRKALEHAFTKAPCPAPTIMKAGISINDAISRSFFQWKDKHTAKSRVLGIPISLALQEADGGPSILEKALCFLEEFGTKVEGILRISADVEEVQQRIQELEQGKTEFDANEDAHVVGDCVKLILRKLPSSPVPINCCNELLKAYDQNEGQINVFRMAILKKLPEPNLLLFKRILKMMYKISRFPENRMTPSAVAACMAPLLLRPILAGECNMMNVVEFSDNDIAQLLAAARVAQAIITLILVEYHNIFSDEYSNRYSVSGDSEKDNGYKDSTDIEILKKRNIGNLDAENVLNGGEYDFPELPFSEELNRSSTFGGSDLYDSMDVGPNVTVVSRSYDLPSPKSEGTDVECKHAQSYDSQDRKLPDQCQRRNKIQSFDQLLYSLKPVFPPPEAGCCAEKSTGQPAMSSLDRKTSSLRESVSAKKMCLTDSLGSPGLEELDDRQLEMKKNSVPQIIEKEDKVNAPFQELLGRRKQSLLEGRLMFHRDVSLCPVEKLHEQLHTDEDRRLVTERRAELEEIAIAEVDVARVKHKVAEPRHQLNQQEHLSGFPSEAPDYYQHAQNAKPCQRFLQQGFVATIASKNHERLWRSHELSQRSNRTGDEIEFACSIGDWMDQKELETSVSSSNSVNREMSYDGSDSCSSFQSSPFKYVKMSKSLSCSPTTYSSVVELANRISFFRRRRSQLVKQKKHGQVPYHLSPALPLMMRPWL
uniref:Rho GTPase activating protein n=1 Tax=Kalanchoe fedtschenkoi TaxID=63787 RepID=A0A7N0URW8_KALFE